MRVVGSIVTHYHFDHTGGTPPPPFNAFPVQVCAHWKKWVFYFVPTPLELSLQWSHIIHIHSHLLTQAHTLHVPSTFLIGGRSGRRCQAAAFCQGASPIDHVIATLPSDPCGLSILACSTPRSFHTFVGEIGFHTCGIFWPQCFKQHTFLNLHPWQVFVAEGDADKVESENGVPVSQIVRTFDSQVYQFE